MVLGTAEARAKKVAIAEEDLGSLAPETDDFPIKKRKLLTGTPYRI